MAALIVSKEHLAYELYCSYDIGRGFLFANEVILSKIPAIIDFGPCTARPVDICENNIKKMLAILTEFEATYPAIACALKSNRAARRILNQVKIVLGRMKDRSIILKEDMWELQKILFQMIKRVAFAPKIRTAFKDIPELLETVDWIVDPDFKREINENHTILKYKAGQIIQAKDKVHQYIYIVATGIIKNWIREDIKLRAEHGVLPNLHQVSHWEVPEDIDDMVLIQGRAKDSCTELKFNGPAYLPNTCKNILILDDVRKRPPVILLLLPVRDYKFHLCDNFTSLNDFKKGCCSTHTTETVLIPMVEKTI